MKELLKKYFKLYCDRSTIHGVRYLFNDDLNSIERICWTIIVVISLIVTLTCYLIIAQRYSDQLLITVVENAQYPVFNVPFPAVAICNQKRINWSRFEDAKSMFLARDATNETHKIFFEFIKRMESLRFGSFSGFNNMEDIDLEKINYVNVTDLTKFLAYRCEDMFDGDCYWRKENFSCCDIFVMEKTEVGFCLVFNSAISGESRKKLAADSFYPWRNSKSGEDNGLDVMLKFNTSTVASKAEDGIFLMVKKAEQWSDVVYSIKGNTDTVVVIRPEVTGTDSSARDIPVDMRGCIYESETSHPFFQNIYGLKYYQWNCFTVCHEGFLLEYCNCTVSMFFPYNATSRECTAADYRCMYKFRDIFSFDKRLHEDKYVKNIQGGMLCPCMISCDALQYFVTVSTLPIVNPQKNETTIMTIDVHYQSEVMLKYRTSREFTYLELIASFGGIVGLFLGASIVSAIEIIYHLTFGLFIYLKVNHFFDLLRDRLQTFRKTHLDHRNSLAISSASSALPKRAWDKNTRPANTRRY